MPKIVIHKGGSLESEHELTTDSISIGRDDTNEVVLPDPSVSRRHARIERAEGGYRIVDLESGNGVRHRGRRIDRLHLYPGCEVTVGTYRLTFEDEASGALAKLVLIAGAPQSEYPLAGAETVLGRSSMAQVPIDEPLASKTHCKIVKRGSVWALVDLGSQNGTLVNGVRVGETELRHGDQIRIGGLTFFFSETGETPPPGSIPAIQPAHAALPEAPPPASPSPPSPPRAAAASVAPARKSLFGSVPKAVVLGGGALVVVMILLVGILLRSPEEATETDFQEIFQSELSAESRKQVDLYLKDAQDYAAQGNLPLALEQYQKILVLAPSHQQALSEVARIEEELGRQAEERARAEREARERAARVAELLDRATERLSAGGFQEARRVLDEALALDPESETLQAKKVEAWVAEGDSHRRRGNTGGAQEAYRQALALDPENAAAKRALAQLSAGIRQARERQERVRTLIETGLAQLKNEQYGPAYGTFSEVLELDPREQRAAEFRDQARALLIQKVEPIYREGVRLYEADQLPEAVQRFNQALALYPDHAETRSFLAKARDRLRQEAIEIYKRAYIYEGLGRLKEALEYYQRTLALLPDPAEEYHQKAAERIENLKTKVR